MGDPVVIIPAEEHPIKLEMIDSDALAILRKLKKAGFSGYLVGGGVRDLYLGKTPKDFDISTDARPGQIRKLFPNSSTIGRRFRLVRIFFPAKKFIEVSTLRSLSEFDMDGPEVVLAPNNTFGTMEEDARRRDLTINALFYEIEGQTIIDYVDGSRDLQNAIIRIVGPPEIRLRRDPVRMIRAIRHAARNSFTIEERSWQAICENACKLRLCPPSRLRDELLKDLYSEASAPWFELAVQADLFCELLPVYRKRLKDSSTTQRQDKDLLQRLFQTIDRLNRISRQHGIHRQKDFFLLALLLTPWAEQRYQLFSQQRSGRLLFQLGKNLRKDLDAGIGTHLNLRRSLRQEIVTLLLGLALLIHNKQKNGWPNRLKKKSYFRSAQTFYNCYQTALTGEPLELRHITDIREETAPQITPPGDSGKRLQRFKPAFAPNSADGVFGFARSPAKP
ncbi:MAG: polya polymerase [Desulfobacterales bacterium]|nr:MAG: polya polymerase [Desulfobacterales bacterium]